MAGKRAQAPRDRSGAIAYAVYAGTVLLPVGYGLVYAARYSVGLEGLLADGFTLRHWAKLGAGQVVWESFAWSLYLAAASTVVTLALALPLALGLRRRIARGPLRRLLTLPITLPATVAALLIAQAFAPYGTAARVARAAGAIGAAAGLPGLVADPYGLGILAAHIGLAVPFFVLLFADLAARERLDDLGALARTLGAGRWAVVRRVSAPLLLRRAGPSAALLFVAVLGSYEVPLVLGGQSPQMLSVFALRKFALFDLAEKPEAFVVAVLYAALVGVLLAVAFGRRARA